MACIIYHGLNDLKIVFFLIMLHCLYIVLGFCAIFYLKCVDCSENQLAHSGKYKLKCTCPKAIFSEIYLPGVGILVPKWQVCMKRYGSASKTNVPEEGHSVQGYERLGAKGFIWTCTIK